MDDSGQPAAPPQQSVNNTQQVVDDAQQTDKQGAQVGISGPREHEPIASSAVDLDKVPEEVVQPSPPEVKIPQEVKEAGVEKSVDAGEIKLDKQVEQAGVAPAKESTPVVTDASGTTVQLPMTYAQATVQAKKTGIWSSVKWLAGEIVYQWKKLKPDVYE